MSLTGRNKKRMGEEGACWRGGLAAGEGGKKFLLCFVSRQSGKKAMVRDFQVVDGRKRKMGEEGR